MSHLLYLNLFYGCAVSSLFVEIEGVSKFAALSHELLCLIHAFMIYVCYDLYYHCSLLFVTRNTIISRNVLTCTARLRKKLLNNFIYVQRGFLYSSCRKQMNMYILYMYLISFKISDKHLNKLYTNYKINPISWNKLKLKNISV